MSEPVTRLRHKLCRELAQSELDARLHTRREAGRLGDVPPAQALLEIAAHADALSVAFETYVATRQPVGLRLAHAVARVFSGTRHYFLDRLIDRERSFRITLLGLKHGVDVAKLLRVVACEEEEIGLALLCDDLVRDRAALIVQAEATLAWFAAHPAFALRAGAHA